MGRLLRAGTLRARELRRRATLAERVLWEHLRGRMLDGIKFRRQVPLGPYFVDFLAEEVQLVIEVDGAQHRGSEHDRVRDTWLRAAGLRVIRLSNSEVLGDIEGALERIGRAIRGRR